MIDPRIVLIIVSDGIALFGVVFAIRLIKVAVQGILADRRKAKVDSAAIVGSQITGAVLVAASRQDKGSEYLFTANYMAERAVSERASEPQPWAIYRKKDGRIKEQFRTDDRRSALRIMHWLEGCLDDDSPSSGAAA